MKRGFTLAEVLIALSIIGVISALTLPGLKSSTGSKKADAWYSKYCNILDGAVRQAMYDHDYDSATLVNYNNLIDQLQGIKNNEGIWEMKDGTIIETFDEDNHVITLKFKDVHIGKRSYKIMNEMEGIDCRNNGEVPE